MCMDLKLRVAICDDEKYFREEIKRLVEQYLKEKKIIFCIDLFTSGLEFCSDDNNLQQYDIIFLDIGMKEMNGMETAYAIREKNQNVDIVFITIMMDYALEGYRVDAVRYILKDDLESLLPECMDTILQKKQEKEMEFPFVGGKRKVLLKEILFIESKSHQLWFERTRENLYMYCQINDLELILSNYDFVRTHQSFLVNLVHIEKINNYLLYLSNGAEIPVTKQRYAKVKEQYLSYKEKM